jgi:hypothetical protein
MPVHSAMAHKVKLRFAQGKSWQDCQQVLAVDSIWRPQDREIAPARTHASVVLPHEP